MPDLHPALYIMGTFAVLAVFAGPVAKWLRHVFTTYEIDDLGRYMDARDDRKRHENKQCECYTHGYDCWHVVSHPEDAK